MTTTLINLTPHPIRIYGWDVPDRLDPGEHEPALTLEPSGTVARIGEMKLGTRHLPNCPTPVEYVEYRHANGLPHPQPLDVGMLMYSTWYVVSLALALAALDRGDLLVPHHEIRNDDGTVIGCRSLARPV